MSQVRRISKNNTKVYRDELRSQVWLYDTCIVEVTPSHIMLRTGGWLTSTTITRMNQVSHEWGLGYSASRRGGEFSVRFKGQDIIGGDTIVLERGEHEEVTT